jgi:GPI inositol-deacylase
MRRRPSASTTDEEEEDYDQYPPNDVSHDLPRNSPDTCLDPSAPPTIAKKIAKPRRKNSRPADPPSQIVWHQQNSSNAADGKDPLQITIPDATPSRRTIITDMARRSRMRNPWAYSWLALATLTSAIVLLLALYQSFSTKQLDPKGGSMSYMAGSFVNFGDFDTEHTRFATKYSLHLYRELGVDEDPRVRHRHCRNPHKL